MAAYELHYWPGLQGRGEFVRLALEEAGVAYRDVAKEGPEGEASGAVAEALGAPGVATPPFAPPFLKHGRRIIGQTAAILLYLGDRHGLAPKAEAGRLWTQQLQLTIADAVTEAHDTHHPIAAGLYYEDQKAEAARRAEDFRREPHAEVPRLVRDGARPQSQGRRPPRRRPRHLCRPLAVPARLGAGLCLPKASRAALRKTPRVAALAERVAARPRIAAYLASDRRIPFNEYGIFRHYPELDP